MHCLDIFIFILLKFYHVSLSSVHPCDRKDKKFCDQVCNKNGTSHECSCNKGYKFAADGKTCVEG